MNGKIKHELLAVLVLLSFVRLFEKFWTASRCFYAICKNFRTEVF